MRFPPASGRVSGGVRLQADHQVTQPEIDDAVRAVAARDQLTTGCSDHSRVEPEHRHGGNAGAKEDAGEPRPWQRVG